MDAARSVADPDVRGLFGRVVKTSIISRSAVEGLDYDDVECDRCGEVTAAYGDIAGGQMALIRPDLDALAPAARSPRGMRSARTSPSGS